MVCYKENDDMEFMPLIPAIVYERKPNLVLVPGNYLHGTAARQNQAYPMGAPPKKIPEKPDIYLNETDEKEKQAGVSPDIIAPCRFRFTYVWIKTGKEFWIWPTYIDRYTIAGFRWNSLGWSYFGIELKEIVKIACC